MKVYRVGGSVRDELLGRTGRRSRFRRRRRHARTDDGRGLPAGRQRLSGVPAPARRNEEYALARTERKSGRGYRGFVFHATPDVTLEADLARRDLTINAIARDEDGTLIDPHGGVADLRARHPAPRQPGIRRGSAARAARRALRGAVRLQRRTRDRSAVARRLRPAGELATLTAERVWQELAKALMEARPSLFFEVLRRVRRARTTAAGSRCAVRRAAACRAPPRDRHRRASDAGAGFFRSRRRPAAGALRGARARSGQGDDAIARTGRDTSPTRPAASRWRGG